MKPYFRLTVQGVDITDAVNDRLLSLTVSDHLGMVNDTFALSLDDRPMADGSDMPMLPHGATIDVEMGYEIGDGVINPFDGLKRMGSFIVDEIEVTEGSDGRAMNITGRATSTNYSFVKKPRSDEGKWRNITLAEIVDTICKRNNLKPRIHEDCDQIVMVANQTNRSDADFLSDLALDYNCVMKVQDGWMYFAPTDKLTEVMLPNLVPDDVNVNRTDVLGWKFTWQGRANFTGVQAKWLDKDKNLVTTESSYTTPHPDGAACWFTITEVFPTQSDAVQAANSRKRQLDYQRATLHFNAIGYPLLMAGSILHLKGRWRSEVPEDWRIITANHKFDSSGYTTDVEAEVKDAKVLEDLPMEDNPLETIEVEAESLNGAPSMEEEVDTEE